MNKENNNSGPPCPIVPCYTIIICLVVSDFTQFLWPQYQYHQIGQIRSDRESRHQVQIGDDLAMDEANSILMRANDQVTIMIWSSCRL